MSDNLKNNPFFGLFGSVKEAQTYSHQNAQCETPSTTKEAEPDWKKDVISSDNANTSNNVVNQLIEDVFCITISKEALVKPLVYVEETATALEPQDKLDVASLEQALFERLLLDEPVIHVVKPATLGNAAINHHVIEKEVLTYLFECHKQLIDLKRWKPELEKAISDMDDLVVRNFTTALSQPELYGEQRLHVQFICMFNDFCNSEDQLTCLLDAVVNMTLKDEGEEPGTQLLARAFFPVLDEIRECTENSTLMNLNRNHMNLIRMFSANSVLGHILLLHSQPPDGDGAVFGKTLFGSILSTSCFPRTGIRYKPNEQFQFDRSMEENFRTGLTFVCDLVHSVFFNLFKNNLKTRHALLAWIGKCLDSNVSRGRLSNAHENEMSAFAALSAVSDGFMLNLCGVLLRLCTPFTAPKAISKLLKVDPTYCATEVQDEAEANRRWIHSRGLSGETCLISLSADSDEPVERPTAQTYNFLTEIFFMTHRALDLGMRVVFDKWMRINQDLAYIQREIDETQASQPAAAQALRQVHENQVTRSLAMRTALLEPNNLILLGDLHVATAKWLIQVVIHPPLTGNPESYAPIEFRPLSFPLSDYIPPTLSCVPEFLMLNVACYQSMVRRFAPNALEERGAEFLQPLLTQVLIFMGSKQRMRNPHLRARLAECLESLIPDRDSDEVSSSRPLTPSVNREELFKYHPHRTQIVRSLLDVFVGIELTVESVGFDQKLNYRRPMYEAMDYLWTIDEQKDVFKALAKEAQENINAVEPPLFLRFINLLLNDATFLLDEALANMAQLKTFQTARENGEWNNLPAAERRQNESQLVQTGMKARVYNILGKETIHTLKYITTEIKSIFCEPTLVTRVASMLNYFLINLVGPKKKNFKVKDQRDYDFKPANLVMDICRIYIHLGDSDDFCLAVSQDGRSYNANLFHQAEEVLVRIGGGMLIADMMQVKTRVAERALQQTAEDEVLAEAPEEFYDPLLSTLMVDPVILPSSRTTCDRSTIASHLLNDQTDPFTKAPLTMDQVIPDVELKQRIEAWKNERLSQRASSSTSEENATIFTE